MAAAVDLAGTTALVTGASSGIGRELARQFASRGADVVLVARRAERLSTLASELGTERGVRALAVPADLAALGAATKLLERLTSEGVVVDHLVNSAGFGAAGPATRFDSARMRAMLDLNVGVLGELTSTFLPGMVDRGRGGLLQLASIAGFSPVPFMAAYGASKAFVLSFTRALALELEGTGVRVTALCPGHVETEFQEVAGYRDGAHVAGTLGAVEVARLGVEGYLRGRTVVVPGALNRAAVLLSEWTPTGVCARVARGLVRRIGRAD